MGKGRTWSESEVAYLQEHWGSRGGSQAGTQLSYLSQKLRISSSVSVRDAR